MSASDPVLAVTASTRWSRGLPALWLGVLLTIAAIVAPTLFALLDRPTAGRVAARLFTLEAQVSLVFCVVLGALERARAVRLSQAGQGSRVSAGLLWVLLALFCTVLGHYALQPAMEAAREGKGPLSFGALHGISTALYGLKTVAVAVLAWRNSRA